MRLLGQCYPEGTSWVLGAEAAAEDSGFVVGGEGEGGGVVCKERLIFRKYLPPNLYNVKGVYWCNNHLTAQWIL